jgi:hypothetical protein
VEVRGTPISCLVALFQPVSGQGKVQCDQRIIFWFPIWHVTSPNVSGIVDFIRTSDSMVPVQREPSPFI